MTGDSHSMRFAQKNVLVTGAAESGHNAVKSS
jgi:hypothetical protein